MSNKKKYTRRIRCLTNELSEKDKHLHPVFLAPFKANPNLCFTNFYTTRINDKISRKISKKRSNQDKNYTTSELQKLMEVPENTLNLDIYLYYYEIYNLDNLYSKINDLINENKPERTCLRIIDCFINLYWNDISKLNTTFYNLFKNINKKYWNKYKLSDDKLISHLKKTFESIKKNPNILNDFHFRFTDHLKNHLQKK